MMFTLKKSLFTVALLSLGQAGAQSIFSPLNEVCSQALDVRNYRPDEVLHLIKGQGKDGWLFGAREFKSYQSVTDMVPELKALQLALRKRGTELVLIYLPPRGVAERQYIDPAKPAFNDINLDEIEDSYHVALAQLSSAGIIAPDILKLRRDMGISFYFPRDHHWNPVAMKATADALASMLNTGQVLNEIPKSEFRLTTFQQTLFATYSSVSNRICRRFVAPTSFQAYRSEKVGEGLLDDASPQTQ